MKNLLLSSFLLSAIALFSQENLVENGTFEKIDTKKIKMVGQIAMAKPWTSPTLTPADLFVSKTKVYDIAIPENGRGAEKPMKGTGYAGLVAYSYKTNKAERSYIQTPLTKKLEAGKEYCVTFHVSLSDLSKFATNHLAAAISKNAVLENNSDILSFENPIEGSKLKVYEQQYYWIPVCGVYKATGGEQFLTIGNFTADEKLTTAKIKRPRGFTKSQKYDAYYYIDNVSVVLKAEKNECDCDLDPGMVNVKTIERDFSSDKNAEFKTVKIINTDGSDGEKKTEIATTVVKVKEAATTVSVDGMVVVFDPKSFALSGDGAAQLDKAAAYLKANVDVKINVAGYFDKSEADVEKLDGRRVGSVYKYLVSKGIAKERVARELGGNDPIDEKQKMKNMRVEISIVSSE